MLKHFFKYQFPALVWIALIFWLSSQHRLPNVHIPQSDKIAHATAFGILCGLSYRAFFFQDRIPRLKQMALFAAFCFTVLYGVTDEIHQFWVPGRSSELYDAFADATGALIFILVFQLMQQIRSRSGRAGVEESAN